MITVRLNSRFKNERITVGIPIKLRQESFRQTFGKG